MNHVYLLTLSNGKQYCGFTSTAVWKRVRRHLKEARRGKRKTKWYNALRRHKLVAVETLHSHEDEYEALCLEIKEIANRDLQRSGYNTSGGGEGATMQVDPTSLIRGAIRNTRIRSKRPSRTRRRRR